MHPVTNWIWLLKDIAGPALVEGRADAVVTFSSVIPGQQVVVQPGNFSIRLPEGEYRVSGRSQSFSFLPGGRYYLDLRASQALDLEVSQETSSVGEVKIRVSVRGQGLHRFALRADNVAFAGGGLSKDVVLKPGVATVLEWRGRVVAKDESWVALVVPDGELKQSKEVRGN